MGRVIRCGRGKSDTKHHICNNNNNNRCTRIASLGARHTLCVKTHALYSAHIYSARISGQLKEARGGLRRERAPLGQGQMGSALMGSLQGFRLLTGTFWGLPLAYFNLPNRAGAYCLFPKSVKSDYFCSDPISARARPVAQQRVPRAHQGQPPCGLYIYIYTYIMIWYSIILHYILYYYIILIRLITLQ